MNLADQYLAPNITTNSCRSITDAINQNQKNDVKKIRKRIVILARIYSVLFCSFVFSIQ